MVDEMCDIRRGPPLSPIASAAPRDGLNPTPVCVKTCPNLIAHLPCPARSVTQWSWYWIRAVPLLLARESHEALRIQLRNRRHKKVIHLAFSGGTRLTFENKIYRNFE